MDAKHFPCAALGTVPISSQPLTGAVLSLGGVWIEWVNGFPRAPPAAPLLLGAGLGLRWVGVLGFVRVLSGFGRFD